MRHLVSVVLSLVLAPLIYAAAGFAAVKVGDATAAGAVNWAAAALGLAAALLAGGLYALLVMARLSPLGPVLAGLGYLGITLWALLDKAGFGSAMPASVLGAKGALVAPVGAGTLLLAVPLLVTIFSPRRWRRSVTEPSPYAGPSYGATVSAAPSYSDAPATTYAPPVYTPTVSAAPTYTLPEQPKSDD